MSTFVPQPAPTTVSVRYLAVFQRFFAAAVDYTQDGDKAGMLLVAHLADALHNVPRMLFHCNPQGPFSPTKMEAWMQTFPRTLPPRDAPVRYVEHSRRILSPAGAAQELELQEDLTDVNLAPPPKMRSYLFWLADACLCMRFLRPLDTPGIWQGLETDWPEEPERADALATFNGVLASVLLPIPRALIQWEHFDEEQFLSDAAVAAEHIPFIYRKSWESFLNRRSE